MAVRLLIDKNFSLLGLNLYSCFSFEKRKLKIYNKFIHFHSSETDEIWKCINFTCLDFFYYCHAHDSLNQGPESNDS